MGLQGQTQLSNLTLSLSFIFASEEHCVFKKAVPLNWVWCCAWNKYQKWYILIPKMYSACMLSCFSHIWLFGTLWTIAHQASLSMGFSRQEYWSGLPCLPSGSTQGLNLCLLHCRWTLYHWVTREALPIGSPLHKPQNHSLPQFSYLKMESIIVPTWWDCFKDDMSECMLKYLEYGTENVLERH